MIPRLAPRRSRQRPSLEATTGSENISPYISSVSSAKSVAAATPPIPMAVEPNGECVTKGLTSNQMHLSPAFCLDRATSTSDENPLPPPPVLSRQPLSTKTHALNPPLSPSSLPSEQVLSEQVKSPRSQDIVSSDWSNNLDSSLTPPVTDPRPLVVSAKRHGQAVRCKHSKRRRRRNPDGSADGASCLWKDGATLSSSQETSSSDEEEELPLFFTQQSNPPTEDFWREYCYGKNTPGASTTKTMNLSCNKQEGSAKRKQPTKGCLLNKKLPQLLPTNKFRTPPTSPDEVVVSSADNATRNSKRKSMRVQFGSPRAAEYDIDGPVAQLTPLPSDVTRKRYSMDAKEQCKEEEEMTLETKRNSAVLAEWEDELEPTMSASRRRQVQRKNRRSSGRFTPSPMPSMASEDNETAEVDYQRLPSPSTMIMEDLASLCVNSPATNGKPTDGETMAQSSSTPVSMGSDESLSAFDSSMQGNITSQFAISLDVVNTTGGAMDTTPPRVETQIFTGNPSTSSKASSQSTETTPPPSNMNLDTIHSVGGALDRTSSTIMSSNMTDLNRHSPISRMAENSHVPKAESLHLGSIATSKPLDIVGMLLRDPGSDQTWEAKDVFLNLVESKPKVKSRIHTLLEALSPQFDGVLSCLEDLKEQAKFCASTKSSTKFRLPPSEAPYAKRLAAQEWRELEIEFFVELAQALERNTERALRLLQKASRFLSDMTRQPDTHSIRPPRRTPRQQIEEEIFDLEQQIEQHKELAWVQEAVEAPYAALRCQATSVIGVCGFRLNEYTGTCLQLAYEHPIAGVESNFACDITQTAWTASYISDAYVTSPHLLPATHVAAVFHGMIAKRSYDDKDGGILQLLQDLPLQDAIMLLSRWLGRLDAVVQELVEISEYHAVAVEWPLVIISSSSESIGDTLNLEYDEGGSRSLSPCRAYIFRPGNENQDLPIPSPDDGKILKALLDSIKM